MKDLSKQKIIGHQKRAKRARAKISGVSDRPRLCVFRSNKHIYLQVINDRTRKTIAAAGDFGLKNKKSGVEAAKAAGILVAEKAKAAKITKVVFDRGGYKYHGRIKAAAEGAREGGLEF